MELDWLEKLTKVVEPVTEPIPPNFRIKEIILEKRPTPPLLVFAQFIAGLLHWDTHSWKV